MDRGSITLERSDVRTPGPPVTLVVDATRCRPARDYTLFDKTLYGYVPFQVPRSRLVAPPLPV